MLKIRQNTVLVIMQISQSSYCDICLSVFSACLVYITVTFSTTRQLCRRIEYSEWQIIVQAVTISHSMEDFIII